MNLVLNTDGTWSEELNTLNPSQHYTQIWHCEPPDEGITYRVMEQTWSDDYRERHIHRIEIVHVPDNQRR